MRDEREDLGASLVEGLRTLLTLGWAGGVALFAVYLMESGEREPSPAVVWLFFAATFCSLFYVWHIGRAEGPFLPRTAALVVNLLPLAYLLLSASDLIRALS